MMGGQLDDVDLRYLQAEDFKPGRLQKWIRPRNPFVGRLAANLKPGLAVQLDLQTLVDVLGGAVCARQDGVINVCLQWQGEKVRMEVSSMEPGMPSICADDAGSLLPALKWYRANGVTQLSVSVASPCWFWLPLHLLARAEADDSANSNQ